MKNNKKSSFRNIGTDAAHAARSTQEGETKKWQRKESLVNAPLLFLALVAVAVFAIGVSYLGDTLGMSKTPSTVEAAKVSEGPNNYNVAGSSRISDTKSKVISKTRPVPQPTASEEEETSKSSSEWLNRTSEKIEDFTTGAAKNSAIEYLENLGCTDIHFSSNLITFKINGFDGQLSACTGTLRSQLFFSEDGELFVPALDSETTDHSQVVCDFETKDWSYCLTIDQVRCLDYIAFNGELFQNGDGSYFTVAEDIRIWTLGEEPEGYYFD